MKKNLRFMFTALLMMFGMTAMAEDVIWSEDWSSVNAEDITTNANPATLFPNYTFTGSVLNEDGTVKSGTKFYSDNMAGGTAPELLIAKNGGSFGAKVALNGKSGETTLSFKSNKNFIEVTVNGTVLTDAVKSGNTYTYTITVPSGTSELDITFKNPNTSTNARFDDAKLYQGSAKKPAGLSWGTSARTVTIGADDNIFPPLSNENNLTVTYSSSEETVATIDATGAITLVAAGQTVISAAFNGNDEYEAQTVSYTLTVKENSGGEGGEGGETNTTITVAKALEIIAGLADGAKTTEEYEVEGYVVNVIEWSPKPDGYGNATFEINDVAGNTTNVLQVFRAKNAEGDFTAEDTAITLGEKVTVKGKLQKYVKDGVTTPEVASGGKVIARNTPTTISNVKANAAEGVVYNLQGQQVMQPTKGLYIINGKKVILK